MLLELFKNLALIVGCLLLLTMIWGIISVPIEKIFRRKKTEKLVAVLDKITKEAIEELKKECEEKSKKQPKKTTKKTTKTKTTKEEK